MKNHVLMVAHKFPHYHNKKGSLTWFQDKIHLGQHYPHDTITKVRDITGVDGDMEWRPKIHTIRENYNQWSRKIEEVRSGKAQLVLKYWSGRPYWTSPVEFLVLHGEQVGIQKLEFNSHLGLFFDDIDSDIPMEEIAQNDGLSLDDFKQWFKKAKYNEPYAVIHFTPFRYPVPTSGFIKKVS